MATISEWAKMLYGCMSGLFGSGLATERVDVEKLERLGPLD